MSYNINDLISKINNELGCKITSLKMNQTPERFDLEKNDKAVWVFGKEWTYNGKDYACATFGSWKSTSPHGSWKSWTKQEERADRHFLKELKILNEKKEAELKKESEERLIEILDVMAEFFPVEDDNFYLRKKKFIVKDGLLQDKDKNLVVPIYKNIGREVCGFQRIVNQTGKNKWYPRGQQIMGNYFYFGSIENIQKIYLCEGIATAATIFELTGVPTVSCFQANNIPNVVQKINHELKGVKIIIAADNDSRKTDAGLFYASRAKKKFQNVAIVMPQFPQDSVLTDFNDLFVTKGDEETIRQLQVKDSCFVDIEYMGYLDGRYFFYSTGPKEIRSFTLEKMKTGNLVELADETFWATKYMPVFDKDGIPTEACNWKASAQMIMRDQNKIGFFKSKNVKGAGSWIDSGHHVLNLGDRIFVDQRPSTFGKSSSLKRFYKPSVEISLNYNQDFRPDFSDIIKAIEMIDFESEKDRIIVIGFLGLAQIFTTQRWRPHMWMRADKGTGKSTVLSFLGKIIQNSTLFQDSTAAGIRQTVESDSRVCLIDEAEGESHRTKQLVELARQSSSGGDVRVVRGTPGGSGLNYTPELMFCFASIRAAELTQADESRIFEVSLKKPKQEDRGKDKERVAQMKKAELLSTDLFSFMNDNLSRFNAEKDRIREILKGVGFDGRFSDQHSPILASYFLLNPKAKENETIAALCREGAEMIKSEVDEGSDRLEFYDTFKSLLFKDGVKEKSFEQICTEYKNDNKLVGLKELLERHGIFFLSRKKRFLITQNNNLNNLFKKQTKFKNYFAQMKSNEHFERHRSKRRRGFFVEL